MELGLEGKIALVTGAGSPVGFGRGIARVLAKNGCDVIVNDIDEEEAKLKQFRRELVDEKEEIASLKEELFARYSVEEFTEKEYRAKIKELESRNTDGLIAAVDEVITRMSKV